MVRKPKGESKAEVITLRLTPRTRYGLELLARQQRRTLSSVAEWALYQAFKNESVTALRGGQKTLQEIIDRLWDPFEPDRLVKLAQEHPWLLTFEEELVWKIIKEESSFWFKQEPDPGLLPNERDNMPLLPDFKRIRRCWNEIQAAASGERVDLSQLD